MTTRVPVARLITAIAAIAALAACDRDAEAPEPPQRISLEGARRVPAAPLPSPDTSGAQWKVRGDGQAIDFGPPAGEPLLTLACALRETPAMIRIIRHVAARPGEKALFPVIGNGTISRFSIDATLAEGEWRWEAVLPASDPSLDVFTGPREIEATLPGGGTLMIEGSRIPGEFVTWCRAGGRVLRVEEAEQADTPGASN